MRSHVGPGAGCGDDNHLCNAAVDFVYALRIRTSSRQPAKESGDSFIFSKLRFKFSIVLFLWIALRYDVSGCGSGRVMRISDATPMPDTLGSVRVYVSGTVHCETCRHDDEYHRCQRNAVASVHVLEFATHPRRIFPLLREHSLRSGRDA